MKIVIVGGGTSGWLTALYVNKLIPNSKITLIESEDIGILGAGEGSVPIFPQFLNSLGILESDFIKNTNATFKIGIQFENWKNDGSSYFHPFHLASFSDVDTTIINKSGNSFEFGLPDIGIDYPLINFLSNGEDINEKMISHKLAYSNKSPYINDENGLQMLNQYSYHFDASLLAGYLRNVAKSKGVNRIVGEVSKINKDKSNNIVSVVCGGIPIKSDFVFDCSGFQRLIIGKEYGSNWVSYKDKLRVDSAIPFFLEQDSDYIKPYTEAIAMDYGWMWKIPLQNRYGCGYIFDSNYLDWDSAKSEVEKFVGKEIRINKKIKFDAGRFDKVWINNCISIGLSSGFTEPLEATAIWTVIEQLNHITKPAIELNNEFIRDEYNQYVAKFNDSVSDFLHFHYLTNKTNTPFWKSYQTSTNLSENLKRKLEAWKFRVPNDFDINGKDLEVFSLISWLYVGIGINDNLISIDTIKRENNSYNLNLLLKNWKEQYNKNMINVFSKSIDNKKLIDYIIKDIVKDK
jgi:tryptophan 7-halogenase